MRRGVDPSRADGRPLATDRTWPRVLIGIAGMAPITALCGELIGAVPLDRSAPFFVLPLALIAIAAGARHPAWGRLALLGLGAGAVATGAYDALRLALVGVGVFVDFIPQIGVRLGATEAAPALGYAWRFFGNGGGMGVAFAMLPWRGAAVGVAYGTIICGCLFATVGFFPSAAEALFALSATTIAGALAGHWIYGAVLGLLLRRHLPPSD